MPFDKIQFFLESNPEYAWFLVFLFGFMESMIITGSFMPSAILFSLCVYLYNTELLTLPWICSIAFAGSHLGDISGFLVGKIFGPSFMASNFLQKRQKGIQRTQKFLNRFGPYTVVIGRFIPAIRPLVPFLLGITDLELKRFYIADIIACLAWAFALALLVVSVAPIFT
ncbi:VTT domain-containing protein [Pseudomonadota bacterium]|jgi:membrane-associated protein|nr:VTT domain-containing protein [Pseudomonadota bacterium]MDC1421311.1 VTT domain-containing protein [Gammaproteobacteria bacterium]MDC1487327.1 VTT domain-containing protein [Gammaproteobacteria bacterium]|tara:strand:+ start:2113 stop:2619 length:507 start_codon:yes stop_codon:yes gene_type:complete